MPVVVIGVFVIVAVLLGITAVGYGRAIRHMGVGTAWMIVYAVFFSAMTVMMFRSALGSRQWTPGVLSEVNKTISALWFIILVYSAVLYTLRFAVRLVIRMAGRKDCPLDRLLAGGRFAAAVLVCTLVLGIIGCVNARILRVKEYKVDVGNGNELICSAAVISDLHIGGGMSEQGLRRLGEMLCGMDVDAVFIVGDMTDSGTDSSYNSVIREVFTEVVRSKHLGVYYAEGNHDRNGGKAAEPLKLAGVQMLYDEAVMLTDGVCLIGRRDVARNPRRLNRYTDIPEDSVKIVLTHQPSGLAELASDGADISISGHTHGEQFPLIYPLIALTNDMVYGMKQFGDMTAITTSGAGEWGFAYKWPSGCEVVKVEVWR